MKQLKNIKQVLHLAWVGSSIALVIFVLFGIVVDFVQGGNLTFSGWFFSKAALGMAVSGMGFSLPVLLYDNEKIPYGWKVFVHLGIGCMVMFLAGILAGWVPFGKNWVLCVVIFFAEVILAFLGWFLFASYYRDLAHRMNQKIQEREPEHGKLFQEASLLEEERKGSYKRWSPETAKTDDFLYPSSSWVLNHLLKERKENWNKLRIKIGLILLFLFVMFFIVMGSLPDSFFEF